MNEFVIEKYNKLLSSFEKIINNTKDAELLESAKDSYLYFIKELAISEKKDINNYITKMQSLNFSEVEIKKTVDEINLYFKENNEVVNEENQEIIEEEQNDIEESVVETPATDVEEIVESPEEIPTETKTETLEEYVFINVYRNENQTIGDEFQKMVFKLQEDLKNPNDVLIETWISNYIAFTDRYEKELDKDKMIKYMFDLFEKYDKESKYSNNFSSIL